MGCHFLLQVNAQPRDQTRVSCSGRRVLYHCAPREAPLGVSSCSSNSSPVSPAVVCNSEKHVPASLLLLFSSPCWFGFLSELCFCQPAAPRTAPVGGAELCSGKALLWASISSSLKQSSRIIVLALTCLEIAGTIRGRVTDVNIFALKQQMLGKLFGVHH